MIADNAGRPKRRRIGRIENRQNPTQQSSILYPPSSQRSQLGNGIHGAGRLKEKTERVNLGLALLSLVCIPGVPLTTVDMAAWCGCSHQAITRIEQSALRKLRMALFYRDHQSCEELRLGFPHARQPAQPRITQRGQR